MKNIPIRTNNSSITVEILCYTWNASIIKNGPHPKLSLKRRPGNGFVLVLLGDLHRAIDEWLDKEIIGFEAEEG